MNKMLFEVMVADVSKMDNKDAGIKDLLHLEFCIVDAIHEEIERNLVEGYQTDIADTIRCILDEKLVRDLKEQK